MTTVLTAGEEVNSEGRRYESNVEKSRLVGRVERKSWGTFDICRVRWGEPMISLSGSIHQ